MNNSRKVLLIVVIFWTFLPLMIADEKSEAEAAIIEAESMIEELNSMSVWMEPALTLKMKAEEYLKMAKEAFSTEDYNEAKEYAELSLEHAENAQGLRAWYLYRAQQRADEGNSELPGRVVITSPLDLDIVSGTVEITVGTTGCIDIVEFYINDVLEYTDTSPPFTFTWDTTTVVDGGYFVSVKGYCKGVFADDDTILLLVSNLFPCAGTVLLLLMVLFGITGFIEKSK